jgi:hypothetical protein
MSRQPARPFPPGLAYLIAHGHAADGSHGDNARPTQHLVNPPHHMPTRLDAVDSWVRLRAQRGNPLTSGAEPAGPPAVSPEQMAQQGADRQDGEGDDR